MSHPFLILATAALAVPSPSNEPENVAIQAVHNYGACVASRAPEGAKQVLAMDLASADYDKQFRRLMAGNNYCIPFAARLGSSRLLFAGALAEAMLKAQVKPTELADRLAYDPARETIVARDAAEDMALCTAISAPKATVAVFATEPATSDEVKALQPLGPVLGECLKKDVKVQLNKPAVRSLLALAAWRIVNTPRKAAQ